MATTSDAEPYTSVEASSVSAMFQAVPRLKAVLIDKQSVSDSHSLVGGDNHASVHENPHNVIPTIIRDRNRSGDGTLHPSKISPAHKNPIVQVNVRLDTGMVLNDNISVSANRVLGKRIRLIDENCIDGSISAKSQKSTHSHPFKAVDENILAIASQHPDPDSYQKSRTTIPRDRENDNTSLGRQSKATSINSPQDKCLSSTKVVAALFLNLPYEIRKVIYDLVFAEEVEVQFDPFRNCMISDPSQFSSQFLVTCKQIYWEGLQALYHSKTFKILYHYSNEECQMFGQKIGKVAAAHVRKISLGSVVSRDPMTGSPELIPIPSILGGLIPYLMELAFELQGELERSLGSEIERLRCYALQLFEACPYLGKAVIQTTTGFWDKNGQTVSFSYTGEDLLLGSHQLHASRWQSRLKVRLCHKDSHLVQGEGDLWAINIDRDQQCS